MKKLFPHEYREEINEQNEDGEKVEKGEKDAGEELPDELVDGNEMVDYQSSYINKLKEKFKNAKNNV